MSDSESLNLLGWLVFIAITLGCFAISRINSRLDKLEANKNPKPEKVEPV
jgi:hypothetical protein